MDNGYVPQKHHLVVAMASRIETELQRRAARAATAVGGKRFKEGATETDFNIENIHRAFATQPTEIWGEECSIQEWELQPLAAWPTEPTTTAKTENDWQVNGIERDYKESVEEKEERLRDRAEWIRSGQLWIDAFTTPAKQRVLRYLHENKRGTTILNTGVMDPTNRFGKVADL